MFNSTTNDKQILVLGEAGGWGGGGTGEMEGGRGDLENRRHGEESILSIRKIIRTQ